MLMLFLMMDCDAGGGGDIDDGLFGLVLAVSDDIGVDVDDGSGTAKLDWYRLFAVYRGVVPLDQLVIAVFCACPAVYVRFVRLVVSADDLVQGSDERL